MNKKEYLNQRKSLMEEAQNLRDLGKYEEATAKLEEVESLDKNFENAAKLQADINAMKDKAVVTDITNKSTVITANVITDEITPGNEIKNEADTYKVAFAKSMLGRELDKQEQEVFNKVNREFRNATQTAETHTVVIPETVRAGIWELIGEQHPIFGDIAETKIPGAVTIIQDTEAGTDAEWVDEDEESPEGELKFGKVELTGCELSKTITVSWKLKKMSIDAFLAHIENKLAKKIGNALAKGIISGKGKPGELDEFSPQARGIITAIEAEASKPQLVEYETDITYKNMTSAMANIKSGYSKGSSIYANNKTIWNQLANIVDTNGKAIFIPDPTSGGVGRIFGLPVKEEDGCDDGVVLIGNPAEGYAVNINEDMTIYNEDHVKARKTDYTGYALVDGDVLTTKAFSLLKKKSL